MKFYTHFLFLLASLVAGALPALAQNAVACDTLIIHSGNEGEYDATLYDAMPNDNFSTDPNFIAEGWTIGGNPITLRTIFKFNLPNLPVGSILNSAMLHLMYNTTTTHVQGNSYYPGSNYFDLNDGTIYRVNQAWDPLTITWNNQPAYSFINAVTVPSSSSQTQGLDINITNLINDYYNDPNSSGFLFKMNTETPYRCQVYASGNHANPALHPKLVLCYTYTNTGINEANKGANIQLNNGLNGQWQIANPEQKALYDIELISMQGQCIKRIPLNNRMEQQSLVSPCDIASGIYLLRLHTEAGMIHTKIHVW